MATESQTEQSGCCYWCCCCRECCANFFKYTLPLKVVFLLTIIAFLLVTVAFGTPLWFEFTYKNDSSVDGYQGLWNHCYKDDDFACCGTITHFFKTQKQEIPVWMQAVRIMLGMAVFFTAVCVVVTKCLSSDIPSKRQAVWAVVISILTGLLTLAAGITYRVGIRDATWSSHVTYSYSFIMTLIAGGFLLICALIISCTVCCLTCRRGTAELRE